MSPAWLLAQHLRVGRAGVIGLWAGKRVCTCSQERTYLVSTDEFALLVVDALTSTHE